VSVARVLAVAALATSLVACTQEPTPQALTAQGIANLRTAKTAHLDGTGSIALKAQGGFSFSFEFKLNGDAELPDKARMNVQMAMLGMSFNVDTIMLDGKEYTKDPITGTWGEGSGTSSVTSVMDPLGNIDASFIRDIVEIDRPEVDGRKTRHLRYQADTTKMLDGLKSSAGASTQSISNAQGTGELWIRIDDGQIVRQLVTVTVDAEGLSGLDLPGTAPNIGKASLEMSLDMRFSRHGEAIPQITAPPLAR
jgi:hypothetical protein